MKAIKNNAFKGSFIEIGYDYFTQSGKKIEPGHIIYIKSAEQLECRYIGKDVKDYKRPYLVWRVEGNKLYVSPITHVYNRYRYALFLQDYPNSRYERYVINSYCTTTTDNIYSVCDKLKDNELDRVFEFIHSGLYFNEGVEEADKKPIKEMPLCPVCGCQNLEEAEICISCQSVLKGKECISCGEKIPVSAKVCPKCGKSQEPEIIKPWVCNICGTKNLKP